jgi:hypothetical protein
MSTTLWLIIGGLGVATASLLFKRWKLPSLPDVTDEQFLKLYKVRFNTPEALILGGRHFIAKHLGLPDRKLSPEQKFEWLAQFTGFAAEYEVGMGDLEDELNEICASAGLKAPLPFPATVGELIHEIAKAKEAS